MNPAYKQRIVRAISFIEKNLAQPISLDLVAEHCHFSSFHFHRVFRGAMNETLNNYVGRRRLEKAINMLAFKKEICITSIALDCGFSSSANFAKAVKKYFGYSPSEIRSPKHNQLPNFGDIAQRYGKKFNPNELYPNQIETMLKNKSLVNVEVKHFAKKRLCKLASKGGYDPESLFKTWDSLIHWGECQGIVKASQYRLAWCYDNPAVTPVQKCRYDASIEIGNDIKVVEPLSTIDLPEGNYAVMYVKGSPDDVNQAQMLLFSDWLPNSGYEPDDIPMLERYLNDVRVEGIIESEVIIKLKKLG
jgi:AraC family transcriptional regulator